jgi:CelD/BcsL family acetyltransferase involved in cellulose biosynthesis
MNITISRGPTGSQLLEDPGFCAQWLALCERCPWSTSYQLPAFVRTWYRIYGSRYEPVIVTSHAGNSELCGILCLALSLKDGRLVVAGDAQSEYQCWVSDAAIGNDFAAAAVLGARREFPDRVLEFRYLPPESPLAWLADPLLRSRPVLTRKRRPLLRFAEMDADSLNKANNKKRLKGLKKLGEMEFRRLSGAGELAEILREFETFYDLRLGAMHGSEPFAQDALKRPFHLALMNEPGLLHVSVLKVGSRLASMQINVCEGKQLHLNLIGYNPLLAKHSPGKFHLHLLSQMLIAEGYEELDLTPGGDPYKERFSNSHDTAFVLSLHPTATSRARTFMASRADLLARKALSAMRIHPAHARNTLQALRQLRVRQVMPRIRDQIVSHREMRLYVRQIPREIDRRERPTAFRRDLIEDLLTYHPSLGGLSRKRFLLDALNRLEEGQHLYSCVEDHRLLHAGWMIERPSEVFVSRVLPGFRLPVGDALIVSLDACAPAREIQLAPACLHAMLWDLANTKDIRRALIGVPARHRQIPILEAMGFSWETSLFSAMRFGRVRRWTRQISAPAEMQAQLPQPAGAGN